jgi:recombination protein RecA
LKENPAIANEIEDKIRAAHGLDFNGTKPTGKDDVDMLED